ncbi:hypothetical protein, partial [Burkholderia mallei]|uniref:hypothetical protein n=1 Tax=Burkholderia mallei TaxID=13373 RepID=UPI001C4A5A5A
QSFISGASNTNPKFRDFRLKRFKQNQHSFKQPSQYRGLTARRRDAPPTPRRAPSPTRRPPRKARPMRSPPTFY